MNDAVGPVLHACPAALAVVAAIRELHPHAEVVDRGAYVRVGVPGTCRVTRSAIERHYGGPFDLLLELERVMASFRGKFVVTEDEARWTASGAAP